MTDPQFKTGDVVRLHSGGLKMTVERVEGDIVHCVWTDKDEKVRRDKFPTGCVVGGNDRIGKLLRELKISSGADEELSKIEDAGQQDA